MFFSSNFNSLITLQTNKLILVFLYIYISFNIFSANPFFFFFFLMLYWLIENCLVRIDWRGKCACANSWIRSKSIYWHKSVDSTKKHQKYYSNTIKIHSPHIYLRTTNNVSFSLSLFLILFRFFRIVLFEVRTLVHKLHAFTLVSKQFFCFLFGRESCSVSIQLILALNS